MASSEEQGEGPEIWGKGTSFHQTPFVKFYYQNVLGFFSVTL